MSDEPKYVLFRVGDGWSALYVDGKLDRIGDTYNVEERIQQLLGVSWQESKIMDAIDQLDEAPATQVELREREADLDARLRRAEDLRAQAAQLEAEAEAIARGEAS